MAHPTIAKIWGSLLLLSGIESPAIQANSDFRVVTQYRTDLTVRDRLREGTRVFEIVSPPADPMGHRRQIEMLVKEQV